jgi:hypothetical protein
MVDGAIGKPRNTQRRAEVSVSMRERAFVLAGSAEPSILLAQGTDRTREDDGMNTGLHTGRSRAPSRERKVCGLRSICVSRAAPDDAAQSTNCWFAHPS